MTQFLQVRFPKSRRTYWIRNDGVECRQGEVLTLESPQGARETVEIIFVSDEAPEADPIEIGDRHV